MRSAHCRATGKTGAPARASPAQPIFCPQNQTIFSQFSDCRLSPNLATTRESSSHRNVDYIGLTVIFIRGLLPPKASKLKGCRTSALLWPAYTAQRDAVHSRCSPRTRIHGVCQSAQFICMRYGFRATGHPLSADVTKPKACMDAAAAAAAVGVLT